MTPAAVTHGDLTAAGVGTAVPLTMSSPVPPAGAATGLREWTAAGATIATPVEIRTPGTLPPGGIRLTRTYPSPVPADAGATFIFFNTKLDAWEAVPSTLSKDRRTLTATVHHLSLWSDLYYGVGKLFDTRVDYPSCTGPDPAWVSAATFIAHDRNNPILFCTGHDTKRPELVVVKARVNRGFGFNSAVAVSPAWTYNSTFNHTESAQAIDAVASIDQVVAQSMRELTANGALVGPGEEISYGITEAAGRTLSSTTPVLRLNTPSVLSFLASTGSSVLVRNGVGRLEGVLAATLSVASCAKDINAAGNPVTAARAALTCLDGASDLIAKKLAVALLTTGKSPREAGKLAGHLVGRLSVYLALVGPVFSSMNYGVERITPVSARSVTVLTRALPTAPAISGDWYNHSALLEFHPDGTAKLVHHVYDACPPPEPNSERCNYFTYLRVTTRGPRQLTLTALRSSRGLAETGPHYPLVPGEVLPAGGYIVVTLQPKKYLTTVWHAADGTVMLPPGNPNFCQDVDPARVCGV